MNFNRDFLRYFGEVEIVHKTPAQMLTEQTSERRYEVMYFTGTWRGETAGGCGNDSISNFVRNPQMTFSLTDPIPGDDKDTCALVISLAQRVRERKTEHAIGFRVYQASTYATIKYHYLSTQPKIKVVYRVRLKQCSESIEL